MTTVNLDVSAGWGKVGWIDQKQVSLTEDIFNYAGLTYARLEGRDKSLVGTQTGGVGAAW